MYSKAVWGDCGELLTTACGELGRTACRGWKARCEGRGEVDAEGGGRGKGGGQILIRGLYYPAGKSMSTVHRGTSALDKMVPQDGLLSGNPLRRSATFLPCSLIIIIDIHFFSRPSRSFFHLLSLSASL